MMPQHAILSPSGAHRWMTCPGSVCLERMFPDTTSQYAEEGTLAHAWAAFWLDPTHNAEPDEELSDELVPYVKQYVDFVLEETQGSEREIELSIDVSPFTGEAGAKGTIDCVAVIGDTLKIIDLKFGKGVLVQAKDNPQLAIYALAAKELFSLFDEIKNVQMTIFQPRAKIVDIWTITADELDRMGLLIRDKAAKALSLYNHPADGLPPDALVISEAGCKFCKAKTICQAHKENAEKMVKFVPIGDDGEPIAEKKELKENVSLLSPEELSENLALADILEPWIDALRERALEEMLEGVVVPNFKLVLGRPGNRTWVNPDEAEALLKTFKLKEDERYSYKLISPTQAEKLYKAGRIGERQWPKLQPLITRPAPAPVIAPSGDKREPWTPVAKQEDFEPIPSN